MNTNSDLLLLINENLKHNKNYDHFMNKTQLQFNNLNL